MSRPNRDLSTLIQELETIEEIESQRKCAKGLSYYIPNAMQLRAHKSKADIILLSAGNRSGKSTAGAAEIAMHVTRDYPSWFPQERKFFKPVKCVVVATENQIIERTLEPKIRQFIPPSYIAITRKNSSFTSRITCIDGSIIDFLSNEQDDMSFESQDWDFYWGDEPQKERKFQAIQRGLVDRHGKSFITFTPLIEPWMKEKLVDKADGKSIDVVTASIYDNRFDIQGNPILSEVDIKRFEDTLPEDVRDTRIYGKFFFLRGQVYKEFSDIHQQEFGYNGQPVICVLDPHDRQPHHLIWAFVDEIDDIYVHAELTLHCTTEELVSKVREIERKNNYAVRRRLIDPNFGRKPLITTGRNMIEELAFLGCKGWGEADDAKEEGHMKVRDYLHFDIKKKIDTGNKPKLFFHKFRVPVTIRSIKNYQYDDWATRTDKDPKEKPKDKETHGADCIRYLCMSNPHYKKAFKDDRELTASPY